MIWLILLGWFSSGATGFIYWFTKDYDIKLSYEHVMVIIMAGLLGPMSWFFGWMIHGDPLPKSDRILFKKRTK